MLAFCLAGSFADSPVQAQVSVNVNIGSQAVWGPVGYDYVEYYYLPEADVFYYVPTGQFIYWNGNQHYFVNSLPSHYSINLYNTYKVVVNEPKPYLQHNVYVTKYKKYKKGGPKQIVIRDSNDERYYKVKGHPHHGKSKGNGNGNQSQNNSKQGNANKSGGGAQPHFNGGKQGGGKQGGGKQDGGKQGGGKGKGK